MQMEDYEALIDSAIFKLRAARADLVREISAYPTPVSGCDIQFNQLLSDRKRISNAIRALGSTPFVPTPRVLEPETVFESS